MLLFFFQAEDGIRDIGVTGVQTCALPISAIARSPASGVRRSWETHATSSRRLASTCRSRSRACTDQTDAAARRRPNVVPTARDRKSVVSGKSVDLGGRRIIKKKNY